MSKSRKNNTTCLVTGGAGFIGSQLVDRLIEEGHRVVVIDDLSNGKKAFVNSKAVFHKMNIASPKLRAIFRKEKPAYVFHLAAQLDVRKSIADPMKDAETNIHGSLNVLRACIKNKAKKLVFSSSGGAIYHGISKRPTPESAVPNPLDPYGVAKLAFELYLHAAHHHDGLDYTALRYANVYGPQQDQKGEGGVVGVFCKTMTLGKRPTIFGDGKQTRDFVYVGDVVEANLLAMKKRGPLVCNIATGKETSVNRVARLIMRETGMAKPPKRGRAVKGEERRSVLDPSLARKQLKWKAETSLEDGIRQTVIWFMGNTEYR